MKQAGQLVEEVYRVGGRYEAEIGRLRHSRIGSACDERCAEELRRYRFYRTRGTDRIHLRIGGARQAVAGRYERLVELQDPRGAKVVGAIVYYVNDGKTRKIERWRQRPSGRGTCPGSPLRRVGVGVTARPSSWLLGPRTGFASGRYQPAEEKAIPGHSRTEIGTRSKSTRRTNRDTAECPSRVLRGSSRRSARAGGASRRSRHRDARSARTWPGGAEAARAPHMLLRSSTRRSGARANWWPLIPDRKCGAGPVAASDHEGRGRAE